MKILPVWACFVGGVIGLMLSPPMIEESKVLFLMGILLYLLLNNKK